MDIKFLTCYASQHNKIRLGNKHDGGYVICELPVNYGCLLSGGICNDITFEEAFCEKYQDVKCFAFDGTIQGIAIKNKNINFIKKNIGDVNNDKITNLHEYINKYDNIFVKMDIERYEYIWLKTLSSEQIDRFAQIVIEFHQPYNLSDIKYLFKKICKTHLMIHIHGNNCSGFVKIEGKNFPDVFEVTYVNKKFMKEPYLLNKEKLPGPLDSPNDNNKKDIDLDFAPFCN